MTKKLIENLREAKTLADADPILKQLRATPTQFKLVEASILQRLNPNPASYEYGVSMLNAVIKELDPEEEPASPESPGLKRKGEGFVKEEELSNHNEGDHSAGSEQSSENTQPYSGEGKEEGDEDMTNAPNTEDQMKEMGGLHPDIAKQMGQQMPKMPPMDTGNQVKQMKYTINKYHETVVKPLLAHAKKQDMAIKKLSQQIRETEARSGALALNLDNDASSNKFRETVGGMDAPMQPVPTNMQQLIATKQVGSKSFALQEARSEITQLNNEMSAIN